MKILKQFCKPIIFAFFTILSLGNLKAQTHNKAAANCIYHDDYVKTASKTKNAVSCVDCYCKICGDKKQKEKEARRKAEELANKQKLEDQKKLAENKKKSESGKQKAKNNDVILVAPTHRVSTNNEKETEKVVEPKKETKVISKGTKKNDKAKIEILLSEISKVYADNKNFETKSRNFKFSFSGTKITMIKTYNPVNPIIDTYTFDLSDIKSIVFRDYLDIYADNTNIDQLVSSGEHRTSTLRSGEYISGPKERSYDDRLEIGKIVELLKQAAVEAGATLN